MKQSLFLLLCTTTLSYGSAANNDGDANDKKKAESNVTIIDLFRTTSEYGDGMGEGRLVMTLISQGGHCTVIHHPATPAPTPLNNHQPLPHSAAATAAAAEDHASATMQLHRQRSNSLPGKSASFSSSPSQTYQTVGNRRNSLPNQELHAKMDIKNALKQYLAQKKFEHEFRTNNPAE